MKSFIIIFFFLHLFLHSNAQDTSEFQTRKPEMVAGKIGFHIEPTLNSAHGGYLPELVDGLGCNCGTSNLLITSQQLNGGYNLGIDITLFRLNHLSLKTGLSYEDFTYKANISYTVTVAYINGIVITTSSYPKKSSISINSSFFNLPLIFQYNFSNPYIDQSWYLSAGMIGSLCMSEESSAPYRDFQYPENGNFVSFINLSLGHNMRLMNNCIISFEPLDVKYEIIAPPTFRRYFSFGIKFGFMFN